MRKELVVEDEEPVVKPVGDVEEEEADEDEAEAEQQQLHSCFVLKLKLSVEVVLMLLLIMYVVMIDDCLTMMVVMIGEVMVTKRW